MYAKTISNERCKEHLPSPGRVTSNMICTVPTTGLDSGPCRQGGKGDSGGPLVTTEGGYPYSYSLIGSRIEQVCLTLG